MQWPDSHRPLRHISTANSNLTLTVIVRTFAQTIRHLQLKIIIQQMTSNVKNLSDFLCFEGLQWLLDR